MTARPHPPPRRSGRRAASGVTVEFLGRPRLGRQRRRLAGRKLVVVICRGGLDGLSLSPPVGDPDYAALRGPIAIAGFGEPAARCRSTTPSACTRPWRRPMPWRSRVEARIAPAIATPDRERSHFEAQDVLESGAAVVYGTSSGWLNRALEAMGPPGRVKAISVGADGAADPARPGGGGLLVARRREPDAITACRPSCRTSTPTTPCWARRSPAAWPPRPWPRSPLADAARSEPAMTPAAWPMGATGGRGRRGVFGPCCRRACRNRASWAPPWPAS